MPKDFEINEYITVVFRKDSPVLASLKEEATQARMSIGPYIRKLLIERNTRNDLSLIVEGAVKSALAGMNVMSTPGEAKEEKIEWIEEGENSQEEANDLAADWGDDDWEDRE